MKPLFTLGLFVLFFSNLPGLERTLQIAGVGLISLSALIAVLTHRVLSARLSAGETLLIVFIISAGLMSLFTFNTRALGYAVSFALMLFSVCLLRRALSFDTLTQLSAQSFALAIVAALAMSTPEFLSALLGSDPLSVVRFQPNGLHPNLTGFVFGLGTFILWHHSQSRSGLSRLAYRLSALLSFMFILAASSRAGLIATLGALFISALLRFEMPKRAWGAVAVFGLILMAQDINWAAQFDRLLALSDPNRGLGTGGTGRVDLWRLSLQELRARSPFELLLGTGIRSSSAGEIGYSTESSYFTLALEHGLLFATLLPLLMLITALQTARTQPIIAQLLLFTLIQSIFNRYLFAIGNPASVLMLFVYTGHLCMGQKWVRA